MDIVIRELMPGYKDSWFDIDSSFTVDSTLVLSLTDQQIGYTVKEIPSYKKSYSQEQYEEEKDEVEYSKYIKNPEQIIYLAFIGNKAVGYIILRKNWNKYAYVEDIRVDKHYRRHGVGRKLIEQAVCWAKAGSMPGIMLETQSNNVKACKFYESCGFVIGGFDFQIYKGIHKHSDEIAIFWYLMFE